VTMAKKAVAKAVESALAVSDERPDWMQEGNRGSESVGVDDLTIPRIAMIQDLSPQRKADKPEYIEGAKEGMIFNTVSGQLYGSDVKVVPCFFRKEWVIWKDRKQGGGFRGAFSTEAAAAAAIGQLEDGDQCEVMDTAQHFVIIVSESGAEEAVISMSRSQMKVSRKLNTLVRMAGGDRFSGIYEFKVVSDQNAQGQDYYNWGVKRLGFPSQEVFHKAERLWEAVSSGEKDVDRSPDKKDGVEATEF
jgi:hypothetical protein